MTEITIIEEDIPLTLDEKQMMGAKVRQLRIMRHMSIEELAPLVHMTPEQLRRFEEGDFEMYDDIGLFQN